MAAFGFEKVLPENVIAIARSQTAGKVVVEQNGRQTSAVQCFHLN